MPALTKKTINCLTDNLNAGTEPTPIGFWTKSVNISAKWATEATKENCLGQVVKIGRNKTVPPKTDVTLGAGKWFLPRKISAKPSYFIDINVNKYYQWNNSLSGVWTQYGGSGKPL